MLVHVTEIEPGVADDQTRAYAEYRVFSALARFGDAIREAAISLSAPAVTGTLARGPARRRRVTCSVMVTLESGSRTRVHASSGHAYDAINRVAIRVGDLLRRQTDLAMSS